MYSIHYTRTNRLHGIMDAIPHLHAWRSSRRRRRFQSDVGDFSLTSSIRRGLATTWFRQDFVDQVQLVQEPNGRLERTVEPHIGCGVTAWIKIMFTADCSREAMLFIAPRRLPSITLRVIGVVVICQVSVGVFCVINTKMSRSSLWTKTWVGHWSRVWVRRTRKKMFEPMSIYYFVKELKVDAFASFLL